MCLQLYVGLIALMPRPICNKISVFYRGPLRPRMLSARYARDTSPLDRYSYNHGATDVTALDDYWRPRQTKARRAVAQAGTEVSWRVRARVCVFVCVKVWDYIFTV